MIPEIDESNTMNEPTDQKPDGAKKPYSQMIDELTDFGREINLFTDPADLPPIKEKKQPRVKQSYKSYWAMK